MLRLLCAAVMLFSLLGCSQQNASFSNSEKQKQWPGANEQKSSTTEIGANTPASKGGNQSDTNHTQNLTSPADQFPNAEGNPGDVTQGNNKNPETQGTTSGPNPRKK